MTGTVEIRGLKDLRKQMNRLDTKMKASIARKSLGKGARIFRDEAKRRVPVNTGNLKNSIASRITRLGKTNFLAKVGPVKRKGKNKDTGKMQVVADGWYGHLVEFGTDPHLIPRRGSKLLKINGRVVRGPVQHPGTPPRPFLRPAFRAQSGKVLDTVGDEMWRLVKRELRKR